MVNLKFQDSQKIENMARAKVYEREVMEILKYVSNVFLN